MMHETNKKNIPTSKLHTILKTYIDGFKKLGVYKHALLIPVVNINEIAGEYAEEVWEILHEHLGCERESRSGPMYITKEHCTKLESNLEYLLKKYTNPKKEEQLREWEPPEVEGKVAPERDKNAIDKRILRYSGWWKKCSICKEEVLGERAYRIEGHYYPVCKRCFHEDLVANVGTLQCIKCKKELTNAPHGYTMTEDGSKCRQCIDAEEGEKNATRL